MDLETFLEKDIVEYLEVFSKEKSNLAGEDETNSLLKSRKYSDIVLDAFDDKNKVRPLFNLQNHFHLANPVNLFEKDIVKKEITPPIQVPVLSDDADLSDKELNEKKIKDEQRKEELKKLYPHIVLPQGSQYTYEYLRKYVLALLAIEREDRTSAVKILYDLYKHYPKNLAVQIRMQEALKLELSPPPPQKSPRSTDVLLKSSMNMHEYVQGLKALRAGDKDTAIKLFTTLKNAYPKNLAVKLRLQDAMKI